ncbi:phosphoglycerate mutase [Companilactobacillus sp. RD055328]|uniref:histidine phosphatase family protein n=1 Tax=Companilactobacillus sp. RD055328 TaxID=2916634 RepID=UPI001FC80AF9|nr:histidine phosphatase family protein [Companilactobacillus sp. RD055328]GKQ42833.1 phosphoglycerate mutase [Companilactobacillus sp. RD055328]
MTKFYFIRHGKTQWNLEGRYQGANGDSPLLEESYTDIKYLSEFLQDIKFDKVFSSPLKRAQVTAETLINDMGINIPIITYDELREFNLGIMEGEKFKDVESKFPGLIWAFRNSPEDYDETIINGESFQDVIKRTNKLIKSIAKDSTGDENYIVVSHGAALVAMIKSLANEKLNDLRKDGGLSNTSVTTMETDDYGESFELLDWNNTQFLHKKKDVTDTI